MTIPSVRRFFRGVILSTSTAPTAAAQHFLSRSAGVSLIRLSSSLLKRWGLPRILARSLASLPFFMASARCRRLDLPWAAGLPLRVMFGALPNQSESSHGCMDPDGFSRLSGREHAG
ncbi:hypothetical protein FN846DRAFT_967226 [Sphaerosporella brunnea]|uniref:Uncharacterized protein n=1 Tax=Sphaerosporella brunnea TaxID=1250544 RepID=A0A5J5EJY3_9PEZI|nr:hypothetical protein FN846DRAFT_967226 [Sphaerosporella brunnea]